MILADDLAFVMPQSADRRPPPEMLTLITIAGDLPPLSRAELDALAILSDQTFHTSQAQPSSWRWQTITVEQVVAALWLAIGPNLVTPDPEAAGWYTVTPLCLARARVTHQEG